jgi:hypothetical protein
VARYDNKIMLKTPDGKPYYKDKFYPNIPLSENDLYVITTIGDRLDYLAYTYYGDSEMWRIISVANNNATNGFLFPIPGTQLRIPAPQNISNILNLFNEFNNAR